MTDCNAVKDIPTMKFPPQLDKLPRDIPTGRGPTSKSSAKNIVEAMKILLQMIPVNNLGHNLKHSVDVLPDPMK